MSNMELLLWARGPGLQGAVAVFVAGMALRLIEIYSLGRKRELSPARPGNIGAGWATIVTRSIPHKELLRTTYLTYILGYTFHIGLFVTLLLFAPHIQLFRGALGFGWPSLPSPVVDAVALVSIAALFGMLAYRLYHPVKRFLTTFGDHAAWLLTLLPLLTGYLSYHHLLLPYTLMLAVHILSVELLLVFMPFTKLVHVATIFISRWYNGDMLGHKGARL